MKPAGRIMGGERLIGVTTFNCKDLGTLHYPVSVDAGSPDAFTAPIIKKGTTRVRSRIFVVFMYEKPIHFCLSNTGDCEAIC
jgi:hypothetical protein